ncbi:CHAT domain-containing protein [Aliiglaciecola sp. M165]|uniref:CHAT domain-containing protein n=1 Tax=Aliiglaciecola sp. M165 TaxID=2593649 RepID=UPI001181677F|nr:CHAT domain-containing protein [Aliiglaciecola sp. M165]TRY29808.1 CHAT domain-containing protein [Aliiglaciecola sp. M165]
MKTAEAIRQKALLTFLWACFFMPSSCVYGVEKTILDLPTIEITETGEQGFIVSNIPYDFEVKVKLDGQLISHSDNPITYYPSEYVFINPESVPAQLDIQLVIKQVVDLESLDNTSLQKLTAAEDISLADQLHQLAIQNLQTNNIEEQALETIRFNLPEGSEKSDEITFWQASLLNNQGQYESANQVLINLLDSVKHSPSRLQLGTRQTLARNLFFLNQFQSSIDMDVATLSLLQQVESPELKTTLQQQVKGRIAVSLMESQLGRQQKRLTIPDTFCHTSAELPANQNIDIGKCFLDQLAVELVGDFNPKAHYDLLQAYWLYYMAKDMDEQAVYTLLAAQVSLVDQLSATQQASLHQYIGLSQESLGELQNALQSYQKAIQLIESSDRTDMEFIFEKASAYYNIGTLYGKIGDYQKSLRYIDNTIAIDESLGDKENLAISQSYRGTLLSYSGQHEAALNAHLTAAVALPETSYHFVVNKLHTARDHLSLGDFQGALQRIEPICKASEIRTLVKGQIIDCLLVELEALNVLEPTSAIAIQDILNDCFSGAKCDESVFTDSRRLSQKLRSCDEILTKKLNTEYPTRKLRYVNLVIKRVSGEMCAEQVQMLYEQAFADTNLIKQVLSNSAPYIAATHDLFATYSTFLAESPAIDKTTRSVKLIEAFEQYHSANFLIEKSTRKQSRFNQTDFDEMATVWQEKLNSEKLAISTSDENQRAKYRTTADIASDKFAAFLLVEESSASELDLKTLSFEQIQSNLSESEAFIHFISGPDYGFAILTDTDGSRAYPSAKANDWEQLSNQLIQAYENNSLLKILRETSLAKLLPISTIDQRGYTKLIIASSGELNRIPLGAFNTSDNSNFYNPLALDVSLVQTMSASAYFEDKEFRRSDGALDIAIFANPTFNLTESAENLTEQELTRQWRSALAPLPFTAREAEAIRSLFAEKAVNLAVGKNATSTQLLSLPFRQSNILHIATHGLYDPQIPDLVAFATADEQRGTDYLTLSQLSQNSFASKLIVLSGCETLQGQYFSGIGMNGLSRNFLLNGAGSVLATLWKVEDHPTSLFMRYFYQGLREFDGNSSKALASAKSRFFQSGRYSHPRYWAGFSLNVANKSSETVF